MSLLDLCPPSKTSTSNVRLAGHVTAWNIRASPVVLFPLDFQPLLTIIGGSSRTN